MTYPLDTLRLRLAVDPSSRSIVGAARALMREGSHRAFFRGLGASMLGAPPSLLLGPFCAPKPDLPAAVPWNMSSDSKDAMKAFTQRAWCCQQHEMAVAASQASRPTWLWSWRCST